MSIGGVGIAAPPQRPAPPGNIGMFGVIVYLQRFGMLGVEKLALVFAFAYLLIQFYKRNKNNNTTL